MKFKEIRFLRDTQKPQTGNSLYRVGMQAHIRDSYAKVLVDAGDAEYVVKARKPAAPAPPPPKRTRRKTTSRKRTVKAKK